MAGRGRYKNTPRRAPRSRSASGTSPAPPEVGLHDGDVSATPASTTGVLPGLGRQPYAVDRRPGGLEGHDPVAGIPGDKARATPAIADGKVIVGTQGPFGGGGKMLAFDKDTARCSGAPLDTHPAAIITQSAVVHDGRVYVGVSSLEEAIASFIPGYPCCSFRGSMAALDVDTGAILWKTTWSAGSPAAPSGAARLHRRQARQVYIATGNNYSIPGRRSTASRRRATIQTRSAPASRPTTTSTRSWRSTSTPGRSGGRRRRCRSMPGPCSASFDLPGERENCPEPPGPTTTSGRRRRCSR